MSGEGKKKKSHLLRRGLVKARILCTLLRSVAFMASSSKPAAGKDRISGSPAAAAPPPPPARQRPTFFLSSTSSLEGFLVEVPKQMALKRRD